MQLLRPTDMTPVCNHPYLVTWTRGTTCARTVTKVLFENATHIVMHHHAHASYVDRTSGVRTCTAHANLYDKKEYDRRLGGRDYHGILFKGVCEWTGRINPKTVKADCAALGVLF